jgi:hypothetical protein
MGDKGYGDIAFAASLRPPGFGTRGKQSTGTEGTLRLLDRRVASLLAMTIPSERSAL